MTSIKWRLGVDVGTNSLGWAAIELDAAEQPCGILAAGSRIFNDGRDPKSGASLAVDRRAARAMRRRRDRFLRRKGALIRHLVADGLFPADVAERKALESLDPYALRARSLDEALPLHHVGRALFHLNQRRGFQSNRKADRKAKDDESGKIAVGVDRLRDAMAEAGTRTYGEWLHMRRASATDGSAVPSVRTRLRPESGENAKGDGYDFYPSRALLKEEFDAIWEAQAPYHPQMTSDVHDRLFEVIFHQRPLKTPKVGMCTLKPGEERLPKTHPLFQRRRLLEELNALMIVRPGQTAERLSREMRDTLFLKLKDKKKVSFETLRKTLKLEPEARFNKESENRPDLAGDEVSATMGDKKRFGNRWAHLSVQEQWTIIERARAVESEQEDAALQQWISETYDLSAEQARAVAHAPLPEGHGRFGLTATQALIEALQNGETPQGRRAKAPPIAAGRVIVYSEAVELAGLGHHSDMRTGEIFEDSEGRPQLPYYGVALERHIMPGSGDPADEDEAVRYGRITNPSVHVALNQIRRVVNRLIRAYGPPAEIAVELARELKMTDEDKKRAAAENNKNRIAAEKRSEKLLSLGQPNTGANRALLRLWEELDENAVGRQCVYSGKVISAAMLFDGRAEVDHILPFSVSLDDSNANKIICTREANREKRKRSPYEAWGATENWEEIAARAARLPRNKRWRFEPDAMVRFEENGGFLARQLVDTQYLARLTREYFDTLYPDRGEGSSHVWVSPGRLTELVRRKLGLNDLLPDHNFAGSKNRLDHRHHAIDAVVIAIVDRSLLQRMAQASGSQGVEGREKIEVPAPWESFREDLRRIVNAIVVSHRPDHGTVSKAGLPKGQDATAGRLHNDTAYGLTGDKDAKGNSIVVHRVPLSSIKKLADVDKIRDRDLKAALYQHLEGLEGKAFDKALAEFPRLGWHAFPGIRRARMIEPLSVIPVCDRQGRIYKGYKGDSNYRYDVWEMKDGKWVSEVVSTFDAHQPGWESRVRRENPTARKVLSLHRDDVLAIERDFSERSLARVVKFSEKQFALAPLHEAGALKGRDADRDDPFKYVYLTPGTLKACRARQVRIDEIGRVLDPGFPARTARRSTKRSA